MMPCLVSPIRKHKIGSDDLVFPAAAEMATYIIWFSCFVKNPFVKDNCFNSTLLQNFDLYGSVLMGVGLVLSFLIFRTSLKGTVINVIPRQHMGKLVVAKLIIDIITVGLVILSTYSFFVFVDFSSCVQEVYSTMLWRLVISWLVVFVILVNIWHWIIPPLKFLDWICCGFLCSILSTEIKERLWKLYGFDDNSVLDGVVDLLMKLFKEQLDIVPTDVLVSLILIKEQQILRQQPLALSSCSTASSKRPAWMNVTLARHYLKFAMGSFGWILYIVTGPLACLKLMASLLKSSSSLKKTRKDDIIGDNFLMCNTIGIQLLAGLSIEEIVYVSFYNREFEVPFFVAVDRVQKSIVVAIRGSLSVHDLMTDLTAQESEILLSDDSITMSAHGGMLLVARNLYRKLLGIDKTGRSVGEGLLLKAEKHLASLEGPEAGTEYNLVITGHSLGAGVAAVLGILLYQHEEYQEKLRCFAFSPPGGLLSSTGAVHCEPFTLSVVLGDDLVTKLSLCSIFDLKLKVLNVLKTSDVHKHAIVSGWLQEKLIGLFGQHFICCRNHCNWMQNGPSWAKDEQALQAVTSYQNRLQEAINSTVEEKSKFSRLYLPGTILYLHQFSGTRVKCYRTYWLCRDAEALGEIIISPNLINHHRPLFLKRALDVLCSDTKEPLLTTQVEAMSS